MLPQEIAQKEDEMSDLSLQLQQFKIEKANIDQGKPKLLFILQNFYIVCFTNVFSFT